MAVQNEAIARIKQALQLEAAAIAAAADRVDEAWARAVDIIAGCQGNLIFFAIGKPGHISKKLAATFASLGTPAFFVHAAEAAHGDLGMISARDVVVIISNSGETTEITARLDYLRRLGCPIIALTRSAASTLGKAATVCLELPVEREADHLNLAPTVSSTLALAAGDALAVTVAERKGFTRTDFGVRHPGGALGRTVNG